MSDAMNGNAGSELEDFYNTYAPKRFPTAKTKRASQTERRQENQIAVDPRRQ